MGIFRLNLVPCIDYVKKTVSNLIISIAEVVQVNWFKFRWWVSDRKSILALIAVCISLQISLANSYQFNPLIDTAQVSSLLLTIGGALIGFTAIVFTMLLFSLQTNIQRLRYLDFHKFSTDKNIFIQLLSCFLIAITIAGSSLVKNQNIQGQTLVIAVWLILLFIVLLYQSYKRALILVSPIEQINLILSYSSKQHNKWDKAIQRALVVNRFSESAPLQEQTDIDSLRYAYVSAYPEQKQVPNNAVDSLCVMAKTYADLNDINITKTSLNSIIQITRQYIEFRKNTFIDTGPFVATDMSSELVFNNTFEQLRQLSAIAIASENEQLIGFITETLAGLATLFAQFNHIRNFQLQHQTTLAIQYLKSHIELSMQLNNTDLMFNDAKVIGELGLNLIKTKSTANLEIVDTLLFNYGQHSLVKKDPAVIGAVMDQYSRLTLFLLFSESDIKMICERITNNIKELGKLNLVIKKIQWLDLGFLSGYYGCNPTSLMGLLFEQVNGLDISNVEHQKIKLRLISNVLVWLDTSYQNRLEQFEFDQKNGCPTFQALTAWTISMSKVLENLIHSLEDDRLRSNCYRTIEKELNLLFFLMDDEVVYRNVEIFHHIDEIFSVLMSLTENPNIIKLHISNIIKFGVKQYICTQNHTELSKCIAAGAILANTFDTVKSYEQDLINSAQSFSAPVTESILVRLRYLGGLTPRRLMHVHSEIENYCLYHLTKGISDSIQFAIDTLTEKQKTL
ncbi:conserved membrane hypothetical protein [Vibrio chagasii]|nr:conserved membrane hypothetical protein [Vibrio chagasii]CAH7087619.1 conserved membrane hypothetical protein [Vibrio chagasii]CAH7430212.1 conserved membrane hypothetical protein [Vibrio chagasii]